MKEVIDYIKANAAKLGILAARWDNLNELEETRLIRQSCRKISAHRRRWIAKEAQAAIHTLPGAVVTLWTNREGPIHNHNFITSENIAEALKTFEHYVAEYQLDYTTRNGILIPSHHITWNKTDHEAWKALTPQRGGELIQAYMERNNWQMIAGIALHQPKASEGLTEKQRMEIPGSDRMAEMFANPEKHADTLCQWHHYIDPRNQMVDEILAPWGIYTHKLIKHIPPIRRNTERRTYRWNNQAIITTTEGIAVRAWNSDWRDYPPTENWLWINDHTIVRVNCYPLSSTQENTLQEWIRAKHITEIRENIHIRQQPELQYQHAITQLYKKEGELKPGTLLKIYLTNQLENANENELNWCAKIINQIDRNDIKNELAEPTFAAYQKIRHTIKDTDRAKLLREQLIPLGYKYTTEDISVLL